MQVHINLIIKNQIKNNSLQEIDNDEEEKLRASAWKRRRKRRN